jgi:hypothetical protein
MFLCNGNESVPSDCESRKKQSHADQGSHGSLNPFMAVGMFLIWRIGPVPDSEKNGKVSEKIAEAVDGVSDKGLAGCDHSYCEFRAGKQDIDE